MGCCSCARGGVVKRVRRGTKRVCASLCATPTLLLCWACKLYSILGTSPKWMLLVLRIAVFAMLCAPAWAHLLCWYFLHANVWRGVPYGKHRRNDLDIIFPPRSVPASLQSRTGCCLPSRIISSIFSYLLGVLAFFLPQLFGPVADSSPGDAKPTIPVVLCVAGGAWTISYKWWSMPVARALVARGYIVVMMDYRNFPQTTMTGMIDDLRAALTMVRHNDAIREVGGAVDKLMVIGQSAGAHIAACSMINELLQHPTDPTERIFSETVFRLFAVSGPYDLVPLTTHMRDKGGFSARFFESIFEGNFAKYSPTRCILQGRTLPGPPPGGAAAMPTEPLPAGRVPRISLLHGTADTSVPHISAVHFARALEHIGFLPDLRLVEGKSHTDFILEDPFNGDETFIDVIADTIASDMQLKPAQQVPPTDSRPSTSYRFAQSRRIVSSLLPTFLIHLARHVNPF